MITLYSSPECPFSHQTRIVLAEKQIEARVIDVVDGQWPEDIAAANPYGMPPVLVDGDLILYDSHIINSYLDERFPSPRLLPAEPAQRAKMRLMLHRMERDWYAKWNTLIGLEKGKIKQARQYLAEDLTVLAPLFADSPYFLSSQFSLLDCSLAPLLWRLPMLQIKLPVKAKAVEAYAQYIFSRDSFQASLSDSERAMR